MDPLSLAIRLFTTCRHIKLHLCVFLCSEGLEIKSLFDTIGFKRTIYLLVECKKVRGHS